MLLGVRAILYECPDAYEEAHRGRARGFEPWKWVRGGGGSDDDTFRSGQVRAGGVRRVLVRLASGVHVAGRIGRLVTGRGVHEAGEAHITGCVEITAPAISHARCLAR